MTIDSSMYEQGVVLLEQGAFDQAEQCFRAAIQAEPGTPGRGISLVYYTSIDAICSRLQSVFKLPLTMTLSWQRHTATWAMFILNRGILKPL